MSRCCVPFCKCKRIKEGDESFHKLPPNFKQRKKWIDNMTRKRKIAQLYDPASKSGLVCSHHFTRHSFEDYKQTKRLKKNAEPTLFDEIPETWAYIEDDQNDTIRNVGQSNSVGHTTTLNSATSTEDLPFKNVKTECEPGMQNTMTYSEKNNNNPCNQSGQILIDDMSTQTETMQSDAKTDDIMEIELRHSDLVRKDREIQKLRKKITKLERKEKMHKRQIRHLKQRHNIMKAKFRKFRGCNKILLAAGKGNLKALMVAEQISAHNKKRHNWPENILRHSVLCYYRSPKAYRYLRKYYLYLPAPSTLKKFVGYSNAETGVTSLVKQRLQMESKKLQEIEKFGSLNFDEMAIRPGTKYIPHIDKIVGYVDMEELNIPNNYHSVANRLLCFIFTGLSTKISIPVSYFFTSKLDGEHLKELILQTIEAVEEAGFKIVRLVCDNCKANVKAFSIRSGGSLKEVVPHPTDNERTMFLSFDSSHIIKNVRSLFLSTKRNLTNDGNKIDGCLVKKLYNMQKKRSRKANQISHEETCVSDEFRKNER